jgi:hypothetical protein
VRVYGKEGKPELLLIHVEIQGYRAGNFAFRMFTYFYRLFEKYHNVPITSISLFTTKKKPADAGIFSYEMMGTKLNFEYNALHIFDYSEAELLAMKSGLGIMILAAQKALLREKAHSGSNNINQLEALNEQRLLLVRALLACKQYDKQKILGLIAFVKNVVYINNPEINHNFDEEISSLHKNIGPMGILELMAEENKEKGIKIGIKKGIQKGREEGIEKGIELKSREIVITLITQLGMDDEMAAGVAKVSVDYVRQIREAIKEQQPPE